MDFDSKLLLLIATVVLHVVVCTDGAATTAAATKTTIAATTAAATKTTISTTTKTTTAATTPNKAETTGFDTNTTVTSSPAGTTTPVTKAPIQCKIGTCIGEAQCTDTTVTEAYNSTICPTGVCLTVKMANGDTYDFKCSSKDCEADKKAAPKDAEVFCCEQPNCNTYESFPSSATRMYSISVAVLTCIVLIISI